MGKLHRLKRRIEKSTLKRFGLRETELGELRKVESKAEARRRALRRHYVRMRAEMEIVQAAAEASARDIVAEEDGRFFEVVNAAMTLRVTTP